jgi:hypothetical protein
VSLTVFVRRFMVVLSLDFSNDLLKAAAGFEVVATSPHFLRTQYPVQP